MALLVVLRTIPWKSNIFSGKSCFLCSANSLHEEDTYKTNAGKSLGLTVILDGHMDKVEPMTIASDFNGFKELITPSGEYPQPSIKGISIKPGEFFLIQRPNMVANVSVISMLS